MSQSALAVHAMAFPDLSAADSIHEAARLGFSGVELIFDPSFFGGVSLTAGCVSDLRRRADSAEVAIVGVSSYVRDLGAANQNIRDEAALRMAAEIQVAADLGSPFVRVLAAPVFSEHHADALREMAQHAEGVGVRLLLEHHMDTSADTVAGARELLNAVAHPAVGILADPANLDLVVPGAAETCTEQAMQIRHLHLKDFRRGDSVASRIPAVPGEGELEWAGLLQSLRDAGAQHTTTFEYEARWFPQLPPIADVSARVLERFRSWTTGASREVGT